MTETLKPLFNQVLLRQVEAEEKRTPSGLLLPGAEKNAASWRCEVLAVGPGMQTDNYVYQSTGNRADFSQGGTYVYDKRPVTDVKVGDTVYVPAYQGYKVAIGMTEYLLVKDTEILAVVGRDA